MPDCRRRGPQRFTYNTSGVTLTPPPCFERNCSSCGPLYYRETLPKISCYEYDRITHHRRKMKSLRLTAASMPKEGGIIKMPRMRHVVRLKHPESDALTARKASPNPSEGEDVEGNAEQLLGIKVERQETLACRWDGDRLKLIILSKETIGFSRLESGHLEHKESQ